MSKESVRTKKKIQPCITSLLSPSAELIEPSAVNSDTVEVPFQSMKSKKQKRSWKSCENSDINPNKKPLTKTPEKMSNPEPNPKDPVINNNSDGIELSPELKELEKHLNSSMLINMHKCIEDTLKPIKDSIDKIVNSSVQIDHHDTEIKCLNEENSVLKTQVSEIQNDMDSIKLKLNQLENKSLECNLSFRGIEEFLDETEDILKVKIHQCIAETFNNQDEQRRLSAARCCLIRKCKWLGRPNPNRPCPVSVEFKSRKDVDAILDTNTTWPKGYM